MVLTFIAQSALNFKKRRGRMSRKSRIEPVREYLEEEITISQCILVDAIKDEDFIKAAWVKEFKVKLEKALSLCGDGGRNESSRKI